MKKYIQSFVRLLICIILSFVAIYAFVFAGGWKLIESGDIVLIEIAFSVVLGFVVFLIYEITKYYDKKIKALEQRIEKLEKKQNE